MGLVLPERHYFSPQNSVANVVNSQFLGLYNLGDLPRYYMPTQECIDFATRLIDKVICGDGQVELVLNTDNNDAEAIARIEKGSFLGTQGTLCFIIGPEGLEQELQGRPKTDPSSWLWDKGDFETAARRNFLTIDTN